MPAGCTACIEACAACLGNLARRSRRATSKLSKRERTTERVGPVERVSDVDGTNTGSLRIASQGGARHAVRRPAAPARRHNLCYQGRKATTGEIPHINISLWCKPLWRRCGERPAAPNIWVHRRAYKIEHQSSHLGKSAVHRSIIPSIHPSQPDGPRAIARRRFALSPRAAASRDCGAGRPARQLLLVVPARHGGKLRASVGRP